MKLLSNSIRANLSSDRVVSEFIIRQAQDQIWGEKHDKKTTPSIHKGSADNQTFDVIEPDDFVDIFSKESPDNTFEGNTVTNEEISQSDWFPVPCDRIIRTHKRRFGNLPGLWNKAFQDIDVSHKEAQVTKANQSYLKESILLRIASNPPKIINYAILLHIS